MNKVVLVGRLTKDPEIRTSSSGKAVSRFSVAVTRPFKNADGEYDADFPNCVAFDKTAEFIGKYFTKGMAIGLVGSLRTGSYVNKDGATVYTTDVNVDSAEFVEKKNNSDSSVPTPSANKNTSSQKAPPPADDEVSDDTYPF